MDWSTSYQANDGCQFEVNFDESVPANGELRVTDKAGNDVLVF